MDIYFIVIASIIHSERRSRYLIPNRNNVTIQIPDDEMKMLTRSQNDTLLIFISFNPF